MSKRWIQNFDQLATTSLRRDGLEILEAGYQAVAPQAVLESKVSRTDEMLFLGQEKIDLASYQRVFLVAVGKCAVAAATFLEPLLLDKLTAGLVLDVVPGKFQKVQSLVGTHPFFSAENIQATQTLKQLLTGLTATDLVLIVISGGASALLALPRDPNLSAEQISSLTKSAFTQGMPISDLNIVRRHLLAAAGGGLAQWLYPAAAVSLIFSDVPGNDLSTVASGPTVFDQTTVADAQALLRHYGLTTELAWPETALAETPKEEKYFTRVKNILILTNDAGLNAMRQRAESLGYNAYIEENDLEGEAGVLGKTLATNSLPAGSCFLCGGEVTVKVHGDGQGGRCQELVLAALSHLPPETVMIAAASDGWDNTPAAGAMGDSLLLAKVTDTTILQKTLDSNSSYDFFKQYGGQIITGKTGANVSDFYLILKQQKSPPPKT